MKVMLSLQKICCDLLGDGGNALLITHSLLASSHPFSKTIYNFLRTRRRDDGAELRSSRAA